MKTKTLMGLVAGAALIVPSAAMADSGKTTQTVTCTGGTIAFSGATTLWPPNHKFRDYTITATPTVSQDMVTLTSTITDNEVIDGQELNGAGNTAIDEKNNPAMASGQGTQTVSQSVRGERSGRGTGRVYTFSVRATFGLGTMPCDGSFTVSVPHDQRKA